MRTKRDAKNPEHREACTELFSAVSPASQFARPLFYPLRQLDMKFFRSSPLNFFSPASLLQAFIFSC